MTELRDQVIPASEIEARLAALPGWHGDAKGIARDYETGWDAAAAAIPQIAALAVEMAHRPDLDIRWTGLHAFLTTHTARDVLTELDLATASRLDAIIAAGTAPAVP
ncbi:MAG: 4a-hydroxytetrahydrobiopterin dehydratase [Trebonia sp.]